MIQPSFAQEIPEGYQLVWQEEFNEEGSVDLSTWNFEKGFVRNNELQWYQEANASQQNGILLIQGRREKLANPGFEAGSENWKKQGNLLNIHLLVSIREASMNFNLEF
ncbi:hypothetical protein V8V91_15865 [Algoriphagus halophilus]|uniref:glycoside hydrolase family 16 protein n=1 Tax=Algoriphagus halophilus TaxID=226505 RepID=UPI00358E27B5